MKKAVNNINCVIFKSQALNSLKMIKIWSRIKQPYSKSNMMILTKNFWRNGKFNF